MIIIILTNTNKLHRGLHHAKRGITVTAHYPVGERTVVCPDTHGCAVLFTYLYERCELFPDAVELLFVMIVSIIIYLKLLLIGVIAWIDSDLFHDARGYLRGVRRKMYISDEWCIVTAFTEFVFNIEKVFGFVFAGSGNADVLTSRLDHSYGLFDGSDSIHRIGGRHRLQTYRVISAERHVSYTYFTCFKAGIRCKVVAVFFGIRYCFQFH